MTERHQGQRRPEIQMLWQPIVYLGTWRPIGFEALGRVAGVGDLQDVLGQNNKTARTLDGILRDAALRTVRVLPPGARPFVNLAAPTIAAVATQGLLLGDQGQGRVIWELSESGGWEIGSAMGARALFGAFALDDVGAGHADLQRIQRLRPPWVKIDRTLVRGCHRDEGKQDVIRALCWLVGRYGGRVVAEGVEDRKEALCIASLGVRYAQGFLFGRPAAPGWWIRMY